MPEKPPLPPLFLERMSTWLGGEVLAFQAALQAEPVTGLRFNPLKVPAARLGAHPPFPLGGRIPWAEHAFLVDAAEKPGRHPWHQAGAYYLQDPSAMAPAALLGVVPGETVLDLAAAPGGKTTQLAAMLQGRGLLVANEIKDKRLGHLAMNVERWGARNVAILNEPPERLADVLGACFDRVLVDAPCSGEGMFRKDMGARLDWSVGMIHGCALRQRNILRVAAHLVRPGGHLMYSTCTFAPEENEGVISEFLGEHPDYHVEDLPQLPGFLPGQPGWLKGLDPSLRGAVRLFPHRLEGDGHFVCLLRRDGDEPTRQADGSPLPQMGREQQGHWHAFADSTLVDPFPGDRLRLRGERLYLVPDAGLDFGSLRVVHPGVWLGSLKKGRFEPAHPLALLLRADGVRNAVDLPAGDPLLVRYLRGETLPLSGQAGWTLICVDGFGLGWGKRVQGVVKNHYPRGWM